MTARTRGPRIYTFHIPYGKEKEHAGKLRVGLNSLGPGFEARLCTVCEGHGNYKQMYTHGCGGGYFQTNGPCGYCKETGLIQGYDPAPMSVLNQVLVAAEKIPCVTPTDVA